MVAKYPAASGMFRIDPSWVVLFKKPFSGPCGEWRIIPKRTLPRGACQNNVIKIVALL